MDLTNQVTELDRLTANGKIMEALDKFYHPDVVTREGNGEELKGKDNHKKKLEAFFSDIESVNDITLHSYAIGDNVSLSEFTFDMVKSDGSRILWNEVLRRKWQDGLVIDERYYTAE